MKKQEIYQGIEMFLDEWDPIGILQDAQPIIYKEGTFGEYYKYIDPIINVYLSKTSMKDYLIKLQTELWDIPDENMMKEIAVVAKRITDFLDAIPPNLIDELGRV